MAYMRYIYQLPRGLVVLRVDPYFSSYHQHQHVMGLTTRKG